MSLNESLFVINQTINLTSGVLPNVTMSSLSGWTDAAVIASYCTSYHWFTLYCWLTPFIAVHVRWFLNWYAKKNPKWATKRKRILDVTDDFIDGGIVLFAIVNLALLYFG